MARVINLVAAGGIRPDKLRPVGSIYQSVVNTNPGALFGGTWQRYGNGRILVGLNTSDNDFNAVGKTGGAKTHTLTVAQMPAHSHMLTINAVTLPANAAHAHNVPYRDTGYDGTFTGAGLANTSGTWTSGFIESAGAHTHSVTPAGTLGNTGSSTAHHNVMPFFTAYAWKRVA